MFKEKDIQAVYAKLSTECPEHSLQDAHEPKGEQPPVQDVIVLHLPLMEDGIKADIHDEVEKYLHPGLSYVEMALDNSQEDKPGSHRHEVTRKGWGDQRVEIYAVPPESRAVDSSPTLVMESARLKGKPSVHVYKFVSVLRVVFRGTLADGLGNGLGGADKRQHLHSKVWITVKPIQKELSLGSPALTPEDIALIPVATEPAKQTKLTEPVEPVEPVDETVEGNQKVGPRDDALPKYRVSSEKAGMVLETMEELSPGYIWKVIQMSKKRTGVSDDKVVLVTWADIDAGAGITHMMPQLREVKADMEKAGKKASK